MPINRVEPYAAKRLLPWSESAGSATLREECTEVTLHRRSAVGARRSCCPLRTAASRCRRGAGALALLRRHSRGLRGLRGARGVPATINRAMGRRRARTRKPPGRNGYVARDFAQVLPRCSSGQATCRPGTNAAPACEKYPRREILWRMASPAIARQKVRVFAACSLRFPV